MGCISADWSFENSWEGKPQWPLIGLHQSILIHGVVLLVNREGGREGGKMIRKKSIILDFAFLPGPSTMFELTAV